MKKSPQQLHPKAGRPQRSFEEASSRTKRRKLTYIAQQHGTEELVLAAASSARTDQNPTLASVLKESIETPTRPGKLRRGMRDSAKLRKARTLTPDEALAVTVAADLTCRGYNVVRKMSNKVSASEVYPPYTQVLQAKKQCCPEQSQMSFSLPAFLRHRTWRKLHK